MSRSPRAWISPQPTFARILLVAVALVGCDDGEGQQDLSSTDSNRLPQWRSEGVEKEQDPLSAGEGPGVDYGVQADGPGQRGSVADGIPGWRSVARCWI